MGGPVNQPCSYWPLPFWKVIIPSTPTRLSFLFHFWKLFKYQFIPRHTKLLSKSCLPTWGYLYIHLQFGPQYTFIMIVTLAARVLQVSSSIVNPWSVITNRILPSSSSPPSSWVFPSPWSLAGVPPKSRGSKKNKRCQKAHYLHTAHSVVHSDS